MREFLTVFSYTFYENVRKKSFIISSVIVLLLTVIVLSIPGIIEYLDNGGKDKENKPAVTSTEKSGTVYVVDAKNAYKEEIAAIAKVYTNYDFKAATEDEINSIQEKIKNDKKNALIVLEAKDGIPYFNYWVKQYGNGPDPDRLSSELKNAYVANLLKQSNVPDATAAKVMGEVSFNVKELGKEMVKSYISSMLIIMLLFFAVYFYGYGVAMSVASEKTSRVMELLLTSTKPSKIILGKSSAMGFLGLSQLLGLVIVAVTMYKLTFPKNFTIMGMSINFSSFTPSIVILIFVYFILGYFLFAMMNAVAGATVSKAEDLHSSMMPISLITLISFYLSYGSVSIPDSMLAVVSSIVPFSAPFSMPSRLLMTDVPIWQLGLSLLSMTVTIIIMAWVSIELYSRAVLHYGKRLKLKDLMSISKQ